MKKAGISLLLAFCALLGVQCSSQRSAAEKDGEANQATARAGKVLTVMSYNIYHGEKAYELGKSNLEEVAAVINRYRPDFVALQEVDSLTGRSAALNEGQRQDLARKLGELTGMEAFFGKAIDHDGGAYGEGILSRHPGKVRNHILPNPSGGERRALLVLESEVPGIGPLVFAGTHLCHQHEENKVAQAEAILTILEEEKRPVVMGGDFNFVPESKPYELIRGRFLDAAVEKGNPEPTISFKNPSKRIDYIFFSGKALKVEDVQVLREDASDHMPVLVSFRLEE